MEGIQNINPEVAGLPAQLLIIRDNLVPGNPVPGGNIPSWDVSLNYVPVPSPAFAPAVIQMKPGEILARVEWVGGYHHRLQLQYDGTAQSLDVVALDGVPTGSQDGTSRGKMTLNIDTGPDGDNDPTRPIASVKVSEDAPEPPLTIPYAFETPHKQRFSELDRQQRTA